MRFRRWYERRESFEEFRRFKQDVRCAVAPRTLETIDQTAVAEAFETFDGNWWPPTVTRQALQSFAILGMNSNVSVKTES